MKLNFLVKFGLVIIVAVMSSVVGNYLITFRPSSFITSPMHLMSNATGLTCQALRSYTYEVMIDPGEGAIQLVIVSLDDFLSSDGDIQRMSNFLLNQTITANERIKFKPTRRGVYITVLKNLSNKELYVGFALTFTREPEIDFIQDSLIIALVGVVLVLIGLIKEKVKATKSMEVS